jgi:hypothetical protein
MKNLHRLLAFTASFLLALNAARAEQQGDWFFEIKQQKPMAFTVSDSGNVFGQWCDPAADSCLYLMALPSACEDEAEYPVLVNADSEAVSTSIICGGKLEGQGLYRYVFSDFDEIDSVVRESSGRMGVAMPLQGDSFKVFRFSLDGAVPALDKMRDAAQQMQENRPGEKTRDKTTRDIYL